MGTLGGGDLPVVAILPRLAGPPADRLLSYSVCNPNQRTQVGTGEGWLMRCRRRTLTSDFPVVTLIWLHFPECIELSNSHILIFVLPIMSAVLVPKSKEPEYVVDKIEDGGGDDEKLGTARDKTDMYRLGKLQELRVSEFDGRCIAALLV